MTEGQVVQLLDDRRPGRLRLVEVCVDVVDKHVHVRGPSDLGGVAEVNWGLAEIDPAAPRRDLELGVESARPADRAVCLAESERFSQELDRRLAVLVQQIWS